MYNDYYDYSTVTYGTTLDSTGDVGTGIGTGFAIFILVVLVFYLFCMVKIYKKAGRKWWEALVPIYNFYVMTQIAGLDIKYFIFYFIPVLNIYAMFKIYIELAKKFGKSSGFGICMIFFAPICLPILAFDKSTYAGSEGVQPTNPSDLNQQPIYARNVDTSTPVQTVVNGVAEPTPVAPVEPVAPVSEPTPVAPVEPVAPIAEPAPVAPAEPVAPIAEPAPVAPVEPVAPIAEPTPVAPVEPVAPITEPTPVAPVEPVAQAAEPTPATKFCPQCGAQVPAEATFCPQCGANLQ